jgi:ribonuclease D
MTVGQPGPAGRQAGTVAPGVFNAVMTTAAVSRLHAVRVRDGDISPGLAAAARAHGTVCLDTETDGLDWAVHSLRTVQAHVPGVWTEIVRVDSGRPDALLALVESPDVRKIFHHAMFDLRFLARRWQAQPAAVACTKIAAKLLDPHGANSLAPLVLHRLGVCLDKAQQISDWSAGTLSDEQIAYAAADVVHLPALLDSLLLELDLRGLRALYDQCCDHLPARVALETAGYSDVYGY